MLRPHLLLPRLRTWLLPTELLATRLRPRLMLCTCLLAGGLLRSAVLWAGLCTCLLHTPHRRTLLGPTRLR